VASECCGQGRTDESHVVSEFLPNDFPFAADAACPLFLQRSPVRLLSAERLVREAWRVYPRGLLMVLVGESGTKDVNWHRIGHGLQPPC
jgi:hypothetical protein